MGVQADVPNLRHDPIVINGNDDFTVTNGVTGGSGTADDPYLIEGWIIDASEARLQDKYHGIYICNTSASLLIRDVYVHSGYYDGISLQFVKNVRIENVTSTRNSQGISVSQSEGVTIKDCHIMKNDEAGVWITSTFRTTIIGNNFTSNGLRFGVGWDVSYYASHTIVNNVVNGKPLLFYRNQVSIEINGADVGQLLIANCENVNVTNLHINDTDVGIGLAYVQNARLSGNTLSRNKIGIEMAYCRNVVVRANYVSENGIQGVYQHGDMVTSNNVTFEKNTISNNRQGIYVLDSLNGVVQDNTITQNEVGICLVDSRNITTHANNISQNGYGVWNDDTYNPVYGPNRFYHNNFIDNTIHVYGWSSLWDNGYPSGGNYWSNYTGTDTCSGPAQDIYPDPDGIGDSPHQLTEYCQDTYPLLEPFSSRKCLLTVASAYGSPTGNGWHSLGEVSVVSVDAVVYTGNATRYVLSGWIGDIESADALLEITVNRSMHVTAEWETQYLVQIQSEHGAPTGSGWYEENTLVTLTVESSTTMRGLFGLLGGQYRFAGWQGEIVSQNTALVFPVDGPASFTVRWVDDYTLLSIGLICIVGGGVLIIVFLRRTGRSMYQ